MRRAVLILFICIPVLGEIAPLESCVEVTESEWRRLTGRIPAAYLAFDPGMSEIALRLAQMRENAAFLKRIPPAPLNEYLIHNALEACKSFQEWSISRMKKFYFMMVCFGLLAVTLTADMLLILYYHSRIPQDR